MEAFKFIKLRTNIKKTDEVDETEKEEISQFIQKNSPMEEEYASNEFFSYVNRDIITVRDRNNAIKFVFSIQQITHKNVSYIYCGDMVKKLNDKSINLTFILIKYMYHKEGLINLLYKNKVFLTFCYNPRIYDLSPCFLKKYSAYDNNLENINYSNFLDIFGFSNKSNDGFFYDKAINKNIYISDPHRYKTKNTKLNQYFNENILQSDENNNIFYFGKSMMLISIYQKKSILNFAGKIWKSLFDQYRKQLGEQRQIYKRPRFSTGQAHATNLQTKVGQVYE